jgi:hypothetical protein
MKAADILAGCIGLSKNRLVFYRFYDGGRDHRGRPERAVLLIAVAERVDRLAEKDLDVLATGPFANFASRQPLPLSVGVNSARPLDTPSDPCQTAFRAIAWRGTPLRELFEKVGRLDHDVVFVLGIDVKGGIGTATLTTLDSHSDTPNLVQSPRFSSLPSDSASNIGPVGAVLSPTKKGDYLTIAMTSFLAGLTVGVVIGRWSESIFAGPQINPPKVERGVRAGEIGQTTAGGHKPEFPWHEGSRTPNDAATRDSSKPTPGLRKKGLVEPPSPTMR